MAPVKVSSVQSGSGWAKLIIRAANAYNNPATANISTVIFRATVAGILVFVIIIRSSILGGPIKFVPFARAAGAGCLARGRH